MLKINISVVGIFSIGKNAFCLMRGIENPVLAAWYYNTQSKQL